MKGQREPRPEADLAGAEAGTRDSTELRFQFLRTWLFPMKRLGYQPKGLCDGSFVPLMQDGLISFLLTFLIL